MRHILLLLLFLFSLTQSFESSSQPLERLDQAALQQLSRTGFYQSYRTFDHTVRGVVVQDIPLASSIVWDCLLDRSSTHHRKKVVEVYDVPMILESWGFRTWRGIVQHMYDPTQQTLSLQVKDNNEWIGIWRVHSHATSTQVSLTVDQTLSTWIPSKMAIYSSWVPSFISQSLQSLLQCTQSSEQQRHIPSRKRGFFGRTNMHKKENEAFPIPAKDPMEATPIGIKRYGLVSTVCVLAMYNIHLYLSQ
jgi:hypothetical protein